MKYFWSILVLMACLFLAGCGGSSGLGANSNITVRLSRTDGTQIMTQYELFITRENEGLNEFDPENHMSTINEPTWADNYSASRASDQLNIGFRTRSDQPPYRLYVRVPNTTSAFETLALRVTVDGTDGPVRTFDFIPGQITQIPGARIERNSATY